ncbi:MAG TPA: type III secretion system export apparatus subunit SctT [Albitalea sp.]|uniref:type III secretion system export apparatus subunit SctT n=1 Tax=Piscinibacter sp. TaxID=1903157 RepID=UPI002ED25B6C
MGEMLTGPEALMHFGESITSVSALMALCTMRIYVAFMVLPAVSDEAVQGPLRNGICMVLGFFVAWGQPAHALQGFETGMLLALLLKEGLIGLMLGIAFSVVFWIAEGVGAMIDNTAGYNNVQQTNPLNGQQSTPVSNLLGQLMIACFYMLGGMVVCVGLLFQSFLWWPLADLAPSLASGLEDFLKFQTDSYFSAVVKLAAPIMLVLVLIDLCFGLLSRTADKLEPQSLSQPIKGAVALLMLSLLVSVFFDQARSAISLHDLEAQLRHWAAGSGAGKR